MSDLRAFREQLEHVLPDEYARPFVCEGSPLRCRAFVVGFNAATRLPHPFTSYWSDETGFLLDKFSADYEAVRSRTGNRPRIERISRRLLPCLETNVFATPSRRITDLDKRRYDPSLFLFLLETIKPDLVFIHSRKAINSIERKLDIEIGIEAPKLAHWKGHRFQAIGRPGPLYRMSFDDASRLGAQLSAYV